MCERPQLLQNSLRSSNIKGEKNTASVHDAWADKHCLPQTWDICQVTQTSQGWGVSELCEQLPFLIDCKTPERYPNSSRHFNLHQGNAEWSSKDKTPHLSQDNHSTQNNTHVSACERGLPEKMPTALHCPESTQPFTTLHFSKDWSWAAFLSRKIAVLYKEMRQCLEPELFKPLTEFPSTPVSPFPIIPCAAMASLPRSPSHLSPLGPDQLMVI